MFGQMDGMWKCHFSRADEKCDWVRTILLYFSWGIALFKDKNLNNLLEAGETADYIGEILNHKFSEVKFNKQSWDNSKKPFNKNYLRNTSGKEGQSCTLTEFPGPSPPKRVNSEEKFNRSPQCDRKTYRQCYNCREYGHIQSNCMKNRNKNGKDDNQTKKVHV